MPQAHSPDFINLPKKQPHGLIANGRPLSNLSTVWKLTAALLKNHYQPRLVAMASCRLTNLGCTPTAPPWSSSASSTTCGGTTRDGASRHGSCRMMSAMLTGPSAMTRTATGISIADTRGLQRQDRILKVHMGGIDGRAPSSTYLGAGTGQGCPVSGMKYCIYGEVRGHKACRDIPPVMTPAGELSRVLLMDDTQWLPGDQGHLHTLAQGIGGVFAQRAHTACTARAQRAHSTTYYGVSYLNIGTSAG